jgi:sterol desaturase/sphingolipid hydroxylase (fatty acid hydroxylase superfamily)
VIYVATILLAVAMLTGFLGIYDLGINMQSGFYAFWALVVVATIALAVDVSRHRRRHFLE